MSNFAKILSLLLILPTVAVADVPVIDNGPAPAEGRVTVQLEEMWRIGGEDDEDNLLGVVNQALADDQGHVYLLDIQLVEVQVFDAEGNYLRSLGQRGDGPGEVRNAFGTVFMPDGTLGLIQGFPGRIVKVDLEGTPAGELRPGGDDPAAGGFFALRSSASLGSSLVLGGMKLTRGDDTRTANHFIATFGSDGAETVRYFEKTTVRSFARPEISEKAEYFPAQGGWALGHDGRIFIAPTRNDYRIDVYGADGTLEKTITRPYESIARTPDELERTRELMTPRRGRNRNAINVVVEPTERDIQALRVDRQGQIWILPSSGLKDQPAGIHSTWDVFDFRGQFRKQVSFACEGEGGQDALFFPGGGLAVLVREHRDAMFAFRGRGAAGGEDQLDGDARPLEVICYKFQP